VLGVGGWLVMGDTLSAGVLVAFVLFIERFFERVDPRAGSALRTPSRPL
jgi:ABC-type protease/lipase transport system fused ATPase/permease subunit